MNLYLTKPGRLKRKDNTLIYHLFEQEEETWYTPEETPLKEDDATLAKKHLPVESIDAVYLFNEVRLNSKLLIFLAQKQIPVHVFNYYGHHSGTFQPHAAQLSGDLVIAQGQAAIDHQRRMHICRTILGAKIHNQLSILQYYQRRKKPVDHAVERVKELAMRLGSADSPETAMGIEGQVSRNYYEAWESWLVVAQDGFKREYHPPTTPLNAIISFLNSLLYTACVSELYRTALYPGISYVHAPQSRRFSLALDLVEPFKPLMADRLAFRLFNQHLIGDDDFRNHSNGILLTDDARRTVLKEWDQLLRTTVDHERLNRSVSYRQLLRLDCYNLAKHLLENAPLTPCKIDY
ncbi:MAG: type I-B CRISPR-associated endonuclease Cas1b [Kiritimatiellae bacterium]|nr:type I-B CRISPR-associated endonuclease Cas1b [Kiritimatiellia bacterium]